MYLIEVIKPGLIRPEAAHRQPKSKISDEIFLINLTSLSSRSNTGSATQQPYELWMAGITPNIP